MGKKFMYQLFIVLIISLSSVSAGAYTMSDYWMLNEGSIWVYDRDMQLMGADTHAFSTYTGRQFIQLSSFYDSYAYIYSGSEGVMAVGMFSYENQQFIDLSATPIKISNAEMNIGDSVTNNIQAGVIDDSAISMTFALEAVENVTVPAGTFNDTLKIRVTINDGTGIYVEHIWLAKNVGPVKMYRVSETNNTPGCFFTCGSYDPCNDNVIINRAIQLKSYAISNTEQKSKVIVVPLGD